jgi:hypothetical protein
MSKASPKARMKAAEPHDFQQLEDNAFHLAFVAIVRE